MLTSVLFFQAEQNLKMGLQQWNEDPDRPAAYATTASYAQS